MSELKPAAPARVNPYQSALLSVAIIALLIGVIVLVLAGLSVGALIGALLIIIGGVSLVGWLVLSGMQWR